MITFYRFICNWHHNLQNFPGTGSSFSALVFRCSLLSLSSFRSKRYLNTLGTSLSLCALFTNVSFVSGLRCCILIRITINTISFGLRGTLVIPNQTYCLKILQLLFMDLDIKSEVCDLLPWLYFTMMGSVFKV